MSRRRFFVFRPFDSPETKGAGHPSAPPKTTRGRGGAARGKSPPAAAHRHTGGTATEAAAASSTRASPDVVVGRQSVSRCTSPAVCACTSVRPCAPPYLRLFFLRVPSHSRAPPPHRPRRVRFPRAPPPLVHRRVPPLNQSIDRQSRRITRRQMALPAGAVVVVVVVRSAAVLHCDSVSGKYVSESEQKRKRAR